jgi:hypothetical protein
MTASALAMVVSRRCACDDDGDWAERLAQAANSIVVTCHSRQDTASAGGA